MKQKDEILGVRYGNAHPKRLRFSVFTVMGRTISHAGKVLLRIADGILKTLIAPAQRKMKQVIWNTN